TVRYFVRNPRLSNAGHAGSSAGPRTDAGASAVDDLECRPGALQGTSLSARWTIKRRPRHHRDRSSLSAKNILYGSREWRSVSHHGWRRELVGDHRWQSASW